MSPKAVTQRCEQRRPSSCPAAVMPPSCMETPDGKGIAQQVRDLLSVMSDTLSAVLSDHSTPYNTS